ncbi:uncharacterized protein [Chelonus insularis]|uniref:uncharacterized protein isoform X2 n=1 Tax=Chelonus insularis TaxID=460826 RepID=UPI00158E1D39|nr:uncharacterized protein LOC118066155 isoform X2 [Chelonus insularis]
MPKDLKRRKPSHSSKVKRKTRRTIVTSSHSPSPPLSQNEGESIESNETAVLTCSELNIPLSLQKAEPLTDIEPVIDCNNLHSSENGHSIPDIYNCNIFNKEVMDGHVAKLFDHLRCSDEVISLLPNKSWGMHCTDVPIKRIVLGELILYNLHGRGFEPFYVKQIIFDEKLNFEIFLLNTRAVLKEKIPPIRSVSDFESVLDYVNSLKLCSGGPDFNKYNKVTPECAYKDQLNKWRHNLCTLEVTDGDVCESCASLDDVLKRHAQRIHSPLKSRNCVTLTRRRKLGTKYIHKT